MPIRRVHLKFDEYLIEHGVVGERDYDIVHDRIDRDFGKWGGEHRTFDPYHTEDGVRDWLRKWCHLANQKTLTDYLRVALGHFVLDVICSSYEYEDEDELIKSAYRSYAQRGFNRCFFREK